MKASQRIGWHLLFWLVYFGINLFNELYLPSSFHAHPSTELLRQSVLAQLLILAVKIPAVYYVLYALIPRWARWQQRAPLLAEALLVVLGLLLAYRALVQLVIWPYVYHNEAVALSALQLTARFCYSLLDLLQVMGIAAAIKLFRLRLHALRREKALVQEKLQSEVLHLKAQLNPHFLFNTLNSIYALARASAPETPDSVMRLSKMLRYQLYEADRKTVALADELKVLEDYVALQQLRFGERLQVQLEKKIDDPQAQVAPLMLLPLLENAYKHSQSGAGACICGRITLQAQQLRVWLQNPVAPPSVRGEGAEGIGLANIRRQLELLYREHRFRHGAEDGVFTVDLELNLSSYAGAELFDRGR